MTLRERFQPNLRRMAVAHAVTRTAIGAAMFIAPNASEAWFGGGTRSGGGRVALRAFAIRDAVIGLGILHQLHHRQPVRHWFQLGLALELTDTLATLHERQELPDTRFPDAVALFGLSGIVGGALVGFGLDEQR
jgi:hypothetical protein